MWLGTLISHKTLLILIFETQELIDSIEGQGLLIEHLVLKSSMLHPEQMSSGWG